MQVSQRDKFEFNVKLGRDLNSYGYPFDSNNFKFIQTFPLGRYEYVISTQDAELLLILKLLAS